MILAGNRSFLQFLLILFSLNVILAVYESSHIHRYAPGNNNQRSADSAYRYAWFTRDIHDDISNDQENNAREGQLSPREFFQLKLRQSLINRKYSNSDETLPE